ncbi:MAG: hypothetical protein ABI120_14495 [Gemmatimonadaceae bacterium]
MKRSVFLAMVLAAATATVTVTACGDDGGSPPIGGGSMTATADGTAFTASLAVNASRVGNTLAVTAVGANNRQISIQLTGVTAPGSVAIGDGSASYAQLSQTSQQWISNIAGGTGTVNVTTLTSTHATGTFTFTGAALTTTGAVGTKTITGGNFDVSY